MSLNEPPILVVPADLFQPPHRAALVRLLNEYCSGSMGEGRPLADDVSRSLADALLRQAHCRVYFAMSGHSIIGLATCFAGFSTFRGRKLVNIHDLVVSRRHRRRGAATALLQHIESEARNEGCCRLTLEVRSDNRKANRLYRRRGFHRGLPPRYFMTKEIV